MSTTRDLSCTVLAVIGVLVLAVLIGIGAWGFRVLTSDIKGRGDAQIQINAAENRLYQYEHFFALCVAVQNSEAAIDAETKRLETTTEEFSRHQIGVNLSGQQINRANAINTYNADSRKYYTAEQFKAWNLPDQLPTGEYIAGSEHTTCAM